MCTTSNLSLALTCTCQLTTLLFLCVPSPGGDTQSRSQLTEGVSRRVLRTEQMLGRKVLQNQPLLTQRVGKEPRGCPRRGWASFSQPGTGLGLLRNFPREGQTALLSPWGGNGTGHTSHRKLTSKERVREEHWLVPFAG